MQALIASQVLYMHFYYTPYQPKGINKHIIYVVLIK